jgi:hypothetical protein
MVSVRLLRALTACTIVLGTINCSVSTALADAPDLSNFDQQEMCSNTEPVRVGGISVTVSDQSPFEQALNVLMDSASTSGEGIKYQQAVNRFTDKGAHVRARASDAINSVFMFKGISTSSEAGDVILNEKLKLKSVGAAKYALQQFKDTKELAIVTNLMQMSSGLGAQDQLDGLKQVEEAKNQLAEIAGPEAAEKALALLKAAPIESQSNTDKPNWTVSGVQRRIRDTIKSAALRDPIVEEIKADVHHYNHHSQLTMAAHRIVRVTLSVTSLAPNIVGPVSQGVLFGYVVLSGGSEQSKILKELYMEKRLADRANLLCEEAHLAFHNYQLGKLTQNKPLAVCSEMVINHLAGAETAQTLLNNSDTIQTTERTTLLSTTSDKEDN